MTNQQHVDFGRAAEDYRTYRTGPPAKLFERLAEVGVGVPGQRIVDLGTGTGNVARRLAQRGCEVVGVDTSETLVEIAKSLDREAGVEISYRVAAAERTGLDAVGFDGVFASQCWAYFDANKATREVRRLLRPGGWLVIAQFDWLLLPGNLVEATEELIAKYNPERSDDDGSGLHPSWLQGLRRNAFVDVETFSFDVSLTLSPEQWRGRVRSSAAVAASLPPNVVPRFDQSLRGIMEASFNDDPLQVPHCVWAIVCRKPKEPAPE